MAAIRKSILSFALVLVALTLFACEQKSPEEKVAELRSRYTVEVNQSGFVATPRYPEPELTDEEMVGEEGEAGDESATGEAAGGDADTDADAVDDEMSMAEPEPEPEGYDILLDLIVATSSRTTLPQLTIDIVHLDPSKNEKNRWPVTLDTSSIVRGPGVQVTQKLENINYEEGDIFFAEVRSDVPPAQRGDYPEFSTAP